MSTKFFREEVDAAVDALLMQQTLLYPTDTVWSLGCDAELPRVVEELHKLQERPAGQPCVVLVADEQMFARYAAEVPANLPELLAAHTQPTTYLVPGSRFLAPNLLGPDGTIGLRITQDAFCHQVIRRLGHGLVATSANRSEEPAPGVYAEVAPALVRAVGHVVTWRQDDTTRAEPSQVLRLLPDGTTEVLK